MRYNNNARNIHPLTNDELHRMAPSIFAQHAAPTTSEKYTFIPTIQIVEEMRKHGFFPVMAAESMARKEEKVGFTKHQIRFRKHDGFSNVGEIQPEVVLGNDHSGGASYTLDAGCFRLACANGLIVPDAAIGSIRVPHRGDILGNVIEGTYSILSHTDEVADRVDKFQSIALSNRSQSSFAKAALTLRWEPEEAPVQAEQLLRARRSQDNNPSLWHTFNRVQENIIRGGLYGRNKSNKGMHTRAVNSVTENTRLNKALWTLADEMAKILE